MHSSISSPSLQYVLASILTLSTIAPVAGLAAETRFGLDADLTHDTNVNRAAYANDEQTDQILAVEGYAARSFRLSYRSGIVVRGGLRLREHREFGDLSNVAALGRVAYRFQPSPGYTGAWIELAGTAEALRYRDSELRDGYVLSGSVSVGKYLPTASVSARDWGWMNARGRTAICTTCPPPGPG